MSATTTEILQEGRYRIQEETPLAGSGTMHDAYDTVRDTKVIVKEIPVKVGKVMTASQQELLKLSFANQAKILTEINHDALLNVRDYFTELGRQYLVMEHVEGDDLKALLERNRSPFDIADVLSWADQMLDSLNYLHTFQPPIIHRQIRPENIRLMPNGKIKLLAFGMADGMETRLSADERDPSAIKYSPLEQIWEGLDSASQKVISASYSERSAKMLKDPADARSDIYSLGATLYHLITGREPLDALERSIELLDGKGDPLPPPSDLESAVAPEVSDVIMRAMQIKREDRFDSAVFMRQVLRTAQIRVKERQADGREYSPAPAEPPPAVHNTEAENIRRQLREAEERRAESERKAVAEQSFAPVAQPEPRPAAPRSIHETVEPNLNIGAIDSFPQVAVEPKALSEDDLLELLLPTESKPEEPVDFNPEISFANLIPEIEHEEEELSHSEAADRPHLPTSPANDVVHAYGAESAVYQKTGDAEDIFSSHTAPSSSSRGIMMAAGGAIVLIIAVIAGWALLGSSPAPEPQPVPAAVAVAPEQQISEPQPSPEQPSLTADAALTETQTAPNAALPAQPEPQAGVPTEQRATRVEAPRADPKAAAPAPRPAKQAPSKEAKKLTVEDLLND